MDAQHHRFEELLRGRPFPQIYFLKTTYDQLNDQLMIIYYIYDISLDLKVLLKIYLILIIVIIDLVCGVLDEKNFKHLTVLFIILYNI